MYRAEFAGFDKHEAKDRSPRHTGVDSLAFRPIPEAWPGRPQNRWLCTSAPYALQECVEFCNASNAQKRPELITRHTSLAVCFEGERFQCRAKRFLSWRQQLYRLPLRDRLDNGIEQELSC